MEISRIFKKLMEKLKKIKNRHKCCVTEMTMTGMDDYRSYIKGEITKEEYKRRKGEPVYIRHKCCVCALPVDKPKTLCDDCVPSNGNK